MNKIWSGHGVDQGQTPTINNNKYLTHFLPNVGLGLNIIHIKFFDIKEMAKCLPEFSDNDGTVDGQQYNSVCYNFDVSHASCEFSF